MSALPAADLWFHGSSVGDARALAPLVAAMRQARPALSCLYTARTQGGLMMARRLFPALPVHPAPIDLPWVTRAAVAAVRPKLVVLEYLELWPCWMAALARAGIPAVVVDGRVTHRSLRFRWLLRPTAAKVSAFLARSAEDALAAASLGVRPERVQITGNGKHDGVLQAAPPPAKALKAAVGEVDVVLGSLHPDEEQAALGALASTGLRALLAPRYPERARGLLRNAARLGITAGLRTEGAIDKRLVILDTVGELASAYGLGKVAIIGGTFGRREGQNLVEAAAHGVPILFGPRFANVREEVAALRGRGAIEVRSLDEAMSVAARWETLAMPDPRLALPALAGATPRNLTALLQLLEP